MVEHSQEDQQGMHESADRVCRQGMQEIAGRVCRRESAEEGMQERAGREGRRVQAGYAGECRQSAGRVQDGAGREGRVGGGSPRRGGTPSPATQPEQR